MSSPLAGNPLRSRDDVQRAVRDCYAPLAAYVSPGGARVHLAGFAASYPETVEELAGFARPLWGLAPLAAGGGEFEGWDRIRLGLVSGSDPGHAEFWGRAGAQDQRTVEMASIGAALLLAPDEVWEPLPVGTRTRLIEWLAQAENHQAPRNELGVLSGACRPRPAAGGRAS